MLGTRTDRPVYVSHAYEKRAVRGGNSQFVDRRSFAEALDCECAHISLPTTALAQLSESGTVLYYARAQSEPVAISGDT
jgi:hypothetical protein